MGIDAIILLVLLIISLGAGVGAYFYALSINNWYTIIILHESVYKNDNLAILVMLL